jgi:hypothetical protein
MTNAVTGYCKIVLGFLLLLLLLFTYILLLLFEGCGRQQPGAGGAGAAYHQQ